MNSTLHTEQNYAAKQRSLAIKALEVLGITSNRLEQIESSEDLKKLNQKLIGNRIGTLCFKYLLDHAKDKTSTETVKQLRRRSQRNVMSSLRNVAFLKKLAATFTEQSISWLLLKGDVLGHELYGDFGVRHSGDIDLWVAEENLEQTHQYLLSEGFTLEGSYFEKDENYQKIYKRFLPHFSYSRDDGVLIEIHWRLFTIPHFFNLPFEEAHSAKHGSEINGTGFPVLEPCHNFLYLMAHASNHFHVRIFWLLDLALYLEKYPEIVNDHLLKRARELGVERVLAYSFFLLNLHFGLEIPDFMRDSMSKHRKRILNFTQVTQHAYEDPRVLGSGERLHEASAWQLFCLESKLSERWSYKKQTLFRYSLNTNIFETFTLPPSLYFCYPLLRFSQLVKQCFR